MTRFARFAPLAAGAFALFAGSLALVSCGRGNAPSPAASESAEAEPGLVAPDAKPGLAVADGRLVLPAVSGNPAAAYFNLVNTSGKDARIAAVDVAGAGMTMLHETKDAGGHSEMAELSDPAVKAGGTLVFAPGGKHVMVMDLPAGLAPGGTVEMTITFDGGDKLSTPLKVAAAGGS